MGFSSNELLSLGLLGGMIIGLLYTLYGWYKEYQHDRELNGEHRDFNHL